MCFNLGLSGFTCQISRVQYSFWDAEELRDWDTSFSGWTGSLKLQKLLEFLTAIVIWQWPYFSLAVFVPFSMCLLFDKNREGYSRWSFRKSIPQKLVEVQESKAALHEQKIKASETLKFGDLNFLMVFGCFWSCWDDDFYFVYPLGVFFIWRSKITWIQRWKVVRLSGCHPTGLVVEKGLISFDDAAHWW